MGSGGGEIPLPYPEPDDPEDEEAEEVVEATPTQIVEAQREAARNSVIDLTRNIQRNKDRELANLQSNGTHSENGSQMVNKGPKIGRNDSCPCGSGKKYKKCHGVNA